MSDECQSIGYYNDNEPIVHCDDQLDVYNLLLNQTLNIWPHIVLR